MRTLGGFPVVVSVVLVATAGPARARPFIDVEKLAACAVGAEEMTLVFDEPIPDHWPNKSFNSNGRRFPLALWKRAVRKATYETLFGRTPPARARPMPNGGTGPAVWAMHARGGAKKLRVYFEGDDGSLGEVAIFAPPHSLMSDYDDIVAALRAHDAWKRADAERTMPREGYAVQQAVLAKSKNEFLVRVAVEYLCGQGAGHEIELAWSGKRSAVRKLFPERRPGCRARRLRRAERCRSAKER